MAELAMKSPDSDPHPGWEFPPLSASFRFILQESWDLDLINESFLRDQFLNWVQGRQTAGRPHEFPHAYPPQKLSPFGGSIHLPWPSFQSSLQTSTTERRPWFVHETKIQNHETTVHHCM
jgi:hypothetical protein